MHDIKAHFDGAAFVPDQPVDLEPGQMVRLHFEPLAEPEVNVPPVVSSLNDVRGRWPEDEPVEEFVEAVRHWRDHEDGPRAIP